MAFKIKLEVRSWALLLGLSVALLGCKPVSGQSATNPGMLAAPIPVVGVHHYGRGHHIGEFQIDGKSCGNAGTPERSSGSDTMCSVYVPEVWRPGIKKHVKWNVTNWTADLSGLQPGNAGTWYEAEAELERYIPSTGAVEVHFYPGGVLRLVPNGYAPPDSDTHPAQTPPLAELPVDEPGWYGMGGCMAAFKHEGRCKEGLDLYEQETMAYLAFLERVWRSRGASEAQVQAVLAKAREEQSRSIKSGYSSYMDGVMRKAGLQPAEIKKQTQNWTAWTLDEMDIVVRRYLPVALQNKKEK